MDTTQKSIKPVQIGDHVIGPDLPTYIIAEIGINHNGDIQLAKDLIEAAADAKVDAVKFQKRDLPSLYRDDVLNDTDRYEQTFQYMIPVLKKVELLENEILELKSLCESKGLEFLCTPFDMKSVDFLAGLDVNAYKIASADLSNLELLEYVASKGKTMLVSTGMSLWDEIEKAVDLLRSTDVPFALMHCRSVYPVWPREVNLRMINRLSNFGCPVGYSGHDMGITIPLVAASMGACIIEKHITLNKKLDGPDHKISLEPYELKRMVRDIRVADQATGKGQRFLLRGEILNRELFGKSLISSVDLEAGTTITREMIRVQGPGKGLAPNRMDALIGKKIHRHIKQGDYFQEEDIKGSIEIDFTHSFKSSWGLICRFSDMNEILAYNPRVLEFHLAEKDFQVRFSLNGNNPQALIVHAPEYLGERLLDLCSGSEDIRTKSVQLVQKTIDLAQSMAGHFQGTPKVIAHPGAMSMNTKLDKKNLHAQLLRSIHEIDYGNVELLMENLPPYPWYFGGQWKGNYFMNATEIRDFCSETGVRICFDLSHAALYCNAKDQDLSEYIRIIMPHIRHIHFADAYGLDGEGVQMGEGDIELDRVMPLFSGYKGSWVPEVWRGHLQKGRGFIEALARLKKYDL